MHSGFIDLISVMSGSSRPHCPLNYMRGGDHSRFVPQHQHHHLFCSRGNLLIPSMISFRCPWSLARATRLLLSYVVLGPGWGLLDQRNMFLGLLPGDRMGPAHSSNWSHILGFKSKRMCKWVQWNTSAIRSWLFYKKCSQNKETIQWGSLPPVQEASKFQVQMKQSAVIAVVIDEPLTGVQKAEGASRQIHSNCPRKLERKSSEATNVSPLSQVCEPFSRLSRLESNRPHMHTHLPSPLCLSDAGC